MNDTIYARVRVEGGDVLVEQMLRVGDDPLLIDALGDIAAEATLVALREGRAVLLEVMDPDGDISTAGEWQIMARVT